MPSYTAWWLANHAVLGGRKPLELRLPGADPLLQGLYADAPAGLDEAALSMLGVRTTLAELLASHGGPEELLDLMADESIEVDRAQLRALWTALAAVDPSRVAPPSRVRAVLEGVIVVAAADDAVVVEAPDLLQLVQDRPLVLASYDLAESLSELLDLPLAGELTSGEVTSEGSGVTCPPRSGRCCRPRRARTWSMRSCWSTGWSAPGGSSRAPCTAPGSTGWPEGSPGPRGSGTTGSRWRRCCATRARCPSCSPRPTCPERGAGEAPPCGLPGTSCGAGQAAQVVPFAGTLPSTR